MTLREKFVSFALIMAILLCLVDIQQTLGAAEGAAHSDPASGVRFSLHALGGDDGSHLSVELEPGMSADLVVVIGNRDTEALVLRTYAADAFTLVNGGFGVREESEPVTEPTTWLQYSLETYELQPGETIERKVSVSVPRDVPAGTYLAGIVAETAEPVAMDGSSMFNQVIRKAIGVTVVVPGVMVGDAVVGEPTIEGDTGGAWLVAPIENTGNISVRPAGLLTLTDRDGVVVLTSPIAMRPVYAGDQTLLEIGLPNHLRSGEYRVSIDLEDDERGWTASMRDVSVTLAEPAKPQALDPVEITSARVDVMPDDSTGANLVYVDLHVEITNREAQIPSSQLTLLVKRDGETLEEVALSESLALLERTTTVEQPYIPGDGWHEGTYTFSLVLESVDPNNGTRSVLAALDIPGDVVVSQ